MTFLSDHIDFRICRGDLLVCMALLLSACKAPIQKSGSPDTSQAESKR